MKRDTFCYLVLSRRWINNMLLPCCVRLVRGKIEKVVRAVLRDNLGSVLLSGLWEKFKLLFIDEAVDFLEEGIVECVMIKGPRGVRDERGKDGGCFLVRSSLDSLVG